LYKLPPDEPLPEMRSSRPSPEDKASVFYISLVNGVLMKHKTWSECEAQVKGRPGVKFKKVKSLEEQNQVLESWGVSGKPFKS